MLDRATEQHRVYTQVKRAQEVGCPATLTTNQWLRAIEHFNGLCAYCLHCRFEVLDHWLPLQDGGGTTADNCMPACKRCNEVKSAYHPHLDDMGRILSRGAVFRALAYIAWIQATPEDAPVYAYVPGALADRQTHSTATVERQVRAAYRDGMTVGQLQRLAGISRSAAGKWRKVLRAESAQEGVAR
jgi:hypothetical protein